MCILFVDDEPLIRMLVEDILLGAGYDIMLAENGPEALRCLERTPGYITALISDLNMSGIPDGAQLIEIARDYNPRLPCLLVTARPDTVSAEWRATHNVTVLAKPFDVTALIDFVQDSRT